MRQSFVRYMPTIWREFPKKRKNYEKASAGVAYEPFDKRSRNGRLAALTTAEKLPKYSILESQSTEEYASTERR
ncbi:hypothetical protein CDAR_431181 [Caerostris darwini]|uniref:Uncharacterized protein n=1 Tax=Caerostris darwini TaxID=1538125 RepID=A0AAV4RS75_9ARAC|nr:hypothetical protein CDAR_431181 [Caerostris darwini]